MKDIPKVIDACADEAKKRGFSYFAIFNYFDCYSDVEAEYLYNLYGKSEHCWNGVGMDKSINVYKFGTGSTGEGSGGSGGGSGSSAYA